VEYLCRYDRVTLRLWSDGHALLGAARGAPHGLPGPRSLAQAAAHALLPSLRRCATLTDLLARYESIAGDLALVHSLVPGDPSGDPVHDPAWRVRDAAFYLRWQELRGPAGLAGAAHPAGDARPGNAGAPCP
jgi:hypothetical protein